MVRNIHGRNGITVKFLGILIVMATLPIIKIQSQSTLYNYNAVCSIELPNKLELQDSELYNVKRVNAQGRKQPQVSISTLSGQIIFQQKGLNANVKSTSSKYCRVMINYYKESRNAPVYGRGEQVEVDRNLMITIYESIICACNANKTPLIKFMDFRPLTINGFPVLYYSYKRKGWEGKADPVIVNVYNIFNRYESVSLYFSYRESEREAWKDIHNYIMKSFNFNQHY